MAVVATTFVREARSKMLALVTSREVGSYVNRPRALREGASGDGFFQDAERAAEAIILCGEIAREEGKTGFSIGQRQVQGYL